MGTGKFKLYQRILPLTFGYTRIDLSGRREKIYVDSSNLLEWIDAVGKGADKGVWVIPALELFLRFAFLERGVRNAPPVYKS